MCGKRCYVFTWKQKDPGVGPVSHYRLLTVVIVVARIVTVAVAASVVIIVVVVVVVVIVIIGGASSGTIVTATLASFQDYCSRGCLRALLIFGLPVYVILRNIRYEFSDDRDEIASSLSRRLSRSYVLWFFQSFARSSTSPLTSLFSQS